MNAPRMAEQLLAHYDQMGRALPWRGERDLYRIWVSEIMLQQTGVGTVLTYYSRFLERFPDLYTLAGSTLEEVLLAWQGLGYYRRAHHLHRAAQQVVQKLSGRLPETLEQWLALPGVGVSTAGAILAIGRDQPHAILDGNVKRVLARLLAFPHPLAGSAAQKQLWAVARHLTPRHRPGDYAQAIMDLGATLCRRDHPLCARCPWHEHCRAHRQGNEASFPVATPRADKPHRVQVSLLVFDARQQLLFCQRPAQGLLAGLWEPPGIEWPVAAICEGDAARIVQQTEQRFGLQITSLESLPCVRHTFTHFHLQVHPFRCRLGAPFAGGQWLAREAWHQLPLATLHRKILAVLEPYSAIDNACSSA
ncbi:MAG: A/G-specific adenine glycosylase [Magnetococcus sp. MYC-9]